MTLDDIKKLSIYDAKCVFSVLKDYERLVIKQRLDVIPAYWECKDSLYDW